MAPRDYQFQVPGSRYNYHCVSYVFWKSYVVEIWLSNELKLFRLPSKVFHVSVNDLHNESSTVTLTAKQKTSPSWNTKRLWDRMEHQNPVFSEPKIHFSLSIPSCLSQKDFLNKKYYAKFRPSETTLHVYSTALSRSLDDKSALVSFSFWFFPPLFKQRNANRNVFQNFSIVSQILTKFFAHSSLLTYIHFGNDLFLEIWRFFKECFCTSSELNCFPISDTISFFVLVVFKKNVPQTNVNRKNPETTETLFFFEKNTLLSSTKQSVPHVCMASKANFINLMSSGKPT